MNELVTAVTEILAAETGSGKLLQGLTILKNPRLGLKDPCVALVRGVENTLEQVMLYRACQAELTLDVMVKVDKRAATSQEHVDVEVESEDWARKVEQVLLGAPTFVSASYPNGLTIHEELTHISRKQFGYAGEDKAQWGTVSMTLSCHLVYNNGQITLR